MCSELTANGVQKTQPIQVGRVFVDGKGVGDVGDMVIRDRRHLSEDGMVLAVMAIHQQSGELVAGPDLISRGFMLAEESEEVMESAKQEVLAALASMNRETRTDPAELKEEVRLVPAPLFRKKLERHPVVLPVYHRNINKEMARIWTSSLAINILNVGAIARDHHFLKWRLKSVILIEGNQTMPAVIEKSRLNREIWGVIAAHGPIDRHQLWSRITSTIARSIRHRARSAPKIGAASSAPFSPTCCFRDLG